MALSASGEMEVTYDYEIGATRKMNQVNSERLCVVGSHLPCRAFEFPAGAACWSRAIN